MKSKTDYRIRKESIAAVKAEERPWVVIEAICRDLFAYGKAQRGAFLRRLTPGQRAFVVLNGLVAEIYNGGIHQYYWNSTGDYVLDAMKALKLIQATRYIPILKASMRLFSSQSVLKNRRRRQSALKKIDTEDTYKRFDVPFYNLNDTARTSLLRLQLTYLKRHPEEFFLVTEVGSTVAKVESLPKHDYRLRSRAKKLRGEALHWAVIENAWDDYWEALKAGKEQAETFARNLTPGQRALIATDILNKDVLRLGGFQQFIVTQVGSDVLIDEIRTGYRLLKALPYTKLFERVVNLSRDTTALARMSSEKYKQRQEVERREGEKAAEKLKAQSRDLFIALQKRKRELSTIWDERTDEFRKLIESPDTRFERFVEAYVTAHPDEFFKT